MISLNILAFCGDAIAAVVAADGIMAVCISMARK